MFIKSSSEINFFFIGMCIICLSFSVEGRDLIGEITKLAKEERELNEKLIRTMTFELAETQNTIAGNSEKYLVKDTENNLWSFKTNTQREVENAKIVSDLAQLLGVSVPVLKGVALPINGREVFGSIQKIGFYDILRKKKPFIKEMTPGEILSLQKLQVFDWLVVMRPGEMYEHCFIISKTGDKMLAIDR
ncbi:hypothetical protein KAU39_01275, partial [bacterium]|nr:hypothetical protein [bacterium]